MSDFAADLFRGTAECYDRFRLPYPEPMLADLVRRADVSGSGRLLDLACGTGQLAFPLSRWFREVWAVDQEPDMADLVWAKAGGGPVRAITSSAETFDVEPDFFELVTIGNAFHRLNRDLVAQRILGWLTPGGCLALCWSSGPWAGERDWQHTLASVVDRWTTELGAEGRVPANWDTARQLRPDHRVLTAAGFDVIGRYEYGVEKQWSVPELGGYVRSTSVLPTAVLADRAAEFDADLAASLRPLGALTEVVSFAVELARKPR